MSSSVASASINDLSSDSPLPKPRVLRPYEGYRGVLQSLELLDDGFLRLTISGAQIDVPEAEEPKLRPFLGRRMRILRLDGYHVAAWRPV